MESCFSKSADRTHGRGWTIFRRSMRFYPFLVRILRREYDQSERHASDNRQHGTRRWQFVLFNSRNTERHTCFHRRRGRCLYI